MKPQNLDANNLDDFSKVEIRKHKREYETGALHYPIEYLFIDKLWKVIWFS